MSHLHAHTFLSDSMITDGCVRLAAAVWQIHDDAGAQIEHRATRLMIIDNKVDWAAIRNDDIPLPVQHQLRDTIMEKMGLN